MGVAGALRRAARDRALPQPRRRPVRPPPPHPVRRPGHVGVYDEASGTWTVTTDDGTEFRARFLVAATGVLSVPYFPDVPGPRRLPRRVVPHGPVAGDAGRLRRQARRRHRHRVERRADRSRSIADEVASLTVYQRTANWCTPLNNAPITADEQAQLRADFEAIRETLNTSASGLPPPAARPRHVRRLRRGAAGVLREDVGQPGLLEAHEQLHRPAVRRGRERRVVRVHRREDPRHRRRSRRPRDS